MQIDFYEQEVVWGAEVYGEKVFGFGRRHVLRLVLERVAAQLERAVDEGDSPAELHLSFVWHPLPEEADTTPALRN